MVVARAREIGAEIDCHGFHRQRRGGSGRDVRCGRAKGGHLRSQIRTSGQSGSVAGLRGESHPGGWHYDDAFDLTVKAAEEFGWYCRNTGYNPFTAEGKKTAAFEIWEWWGEEHRTWHEPGNPLDHHSPLTIFVSVGDGNIISGIHKGFKDLQALGWMERLPRIIGVQAEGSAAIANAFHAGTEQIIPVSAKTIADSISVDLPRDGVRAVRAARETGGTYILVSDDEILQAIASPRPAGNLCRAGRGNFLCRSGQGSWAGNCQARGPGAGIEYGFRSEGRARRHAGGGRSPGDRTDFGGGEAIAMKKDSQWSLPVRYLVFALVSLLFAVVLWYIRSVLEPLIIAAFIAYLINPAVNFLITRTRMSRKAAVNLVYFITLAVLIGTPATLTPLFFDEFTQVITDVLNHFNQLIALVGKADRHPRHSDRFRPIGQPA